MGSFGVRSVFGYLVILVLPAATLAVTQPLCHCGPVTPESYKWNFSKEAAGLVSQIHFDAYRAKEIAGRLEAYDREPNLIDWQAHAALLDHEKYWANDMERKLCRLKIVARVLPADQQAEIKTLAPPVVEITNATQEAIVFVNDHPNQLFVPEYQALAPDLYSEASRATAASAHAGQYMEANYAVNQAGAQHNLRSGS